MTEPTERPFSDCTIGVVMGGLSGERAVSLQTGQAVLTALRERGYNAVEVDWQVPGELPGILADLQIEVVWNALHGKFGEDGAVQGLLTCLRIPYTGSGILASALAMDKMASKRAFELSGIPTPAWLAFDPAADPDQAELPDGWEYPVVVKPCREGSSLGISIVRSQDGLAPALAAAGKHDIAMVEQFVDGAEVAVCVLDDEVLGSVEIRPATEFYDYEAKYVRDDTEYLIPPHIDAESLERVHEIAIATHMALGCRGYSRIDFIVDGDGNAYAIEANTLPGMTGHSLLPKAAEHRGMSYGELCERILATAGL